jgi:hypothetical protein
MVFGVLPLRVIMDKRLCALPYMVDIKSGDIWWGDQETAKRSDSDSEVMVTFRREQNPPKRATRASN